ncbi:SPL family radical SAM protein [Anaerocellum danielii]|uniref:Radical SAM protein n=1 Tax=Anaerocellum danielii TaxID=1387557 RepID=A0ABZ0TYZ8_9FIRM|nr:radical SAM protein [Caldicellulosiruptor danielii]WPX08693.1 radical SAM protein [Caldicellulosiruptor danielii]
MGVERKNLLYKSGVEYADYTINHVLGCSHGCRYPCYAYLMNKRFGKIKSYNEWIQPRVVTNTLELLNKELPKIHDKIDHVNLCFSTDPFMFEQPQISKLSLEIIEILNDWNIPVETLTKGVYPKELIGISSHNNNRFGITLVSYFEDFRKAFEPGAAPIEERIKSLKVLHYAGFKTWVSIEPYPTPNIIEQDIDKLLEKISFVDKIVFGRWNYNTLSKSFENHKEFYLKISEKVQEFCEKNNIELIVKSEVYK